MKIIKFCKAAVLALLLTVAGSEFYAAAAQEWTFETKCGKTTEYVVYDLQKKGENLILTTHYNQRVLTMIMAPDFQTKVFTVSDPDEKTEVKVTLADGVYKVSGKYKNKDITNSFKSDGLPWYQHIGFAAGTILKKGEKTRFLCFRPTDIKPFNMVASIVGEGEGDYKNLTEVKVTPDGALAKFWKSFYYFDSNREFAGYHAVEGGPGTPESFWTLKSRK